MINQSKLYSYIALLFFIVMILSLMVFVLQRKRNQPPIEESTKITQPVPTTMEIKITKQPTIIPTFTGAADEELPKQERDLVDQKQALKQKLPLTETGFTITFDYSEDKFIVDLVEPKGENRIKFNQWLKTNYPAIPLDRFILK